MREPSGFEDPVFEERVAAALRRYAEGAPTEVDAVAVARELARAHPRRSSLVAFGAWRRPAALRLAWLLLLIALLAVVLMSLAVVGHPTVIRLGRAAVAGSATCTESAAGSASAAGELVRIDGIVTECAVALSDPRVGREQMTETRYAARDGSASGTATSELQGRSGRWTGRASTRLFPNGVRVVEGTYEGSGEDAGLELVLRAVSADGRTWDLTGWIERRP